MDPVAGTVVGGKYRLDRPLARGGMGAVWAGHHLRLDVPIAVKFMAADEGRTGRARFEREARAAASLRSPHVVQVLDYDATGDQPYIVMELLEGEDLGHRLHQRGRLSLDEVLVIVRALSAGLTLAHETGIVHRDLKPGNVFMARIGGQEIVKILDFGVAKDTKLDVSDTQTTTGVVVGSPSYMSPEQARGGAIDSRSDLWSLAVVVFQALTGRRPFEGKNLGDVLVRICSDTLPVATAVRADLPPAIDAFFERAFCRSPDGRFQSAHALLRALERVRDPGLPAEDEASLAPRADVTGAIEALPASAVAVDADNIATVKARSLEIAPTIEAPRSAMFEAPAEPPLATMAGTSMSIQRKSDRRGVVWALGGAIGVGAIWVVSQSSLWRSDKAPTSNAPASSPASNATAVSERAADSAPPQPMVSLAATSSAIAVSASVDPSASSTSPAPVVRPPIRRPPATGAVDPKFGLPGGRSN